MKNKIKINIVLLLVLFWGIGFPTKTAWSTTDNVAPLTLSFLFEKESYFDPDYLILDLEVRNNLEAINLVNSHIKFDPAMLTLVETDFTDSFCELFIEDSIRNFSGEYALSCGNPSGTSEPTVKIAKLKFEKLQEGPTTIEYKEATSVHAANGTGQDILGSREIFNIEVIK